MLNDPVQIVAARIRDLRLLKNWSQEELAEKCDLHRTYIGSVERSERNITLRTLKRFADALGCEMAELLKSSEEKV